MVGYAYKSGVEDSRLKSSDVNIMPIRLCNATLIETEQKQSECKYCVTYCKVMSSNTSCLEAHAGFFTLLMKGIFDPFVL